LRRGGVPLFFLLALAALGASMVVAVGHGSSPMSPSVVLKVLGLHLLPGGWIDAAGLERADDLIVWNVRLPRVLLAALVGAALALAGAQMQAVFRNPLADPGLAGVGAGAALGGVLAFTTGAAALAAPLLPALAFTGGLAALLLVYAVATQGGRTSVIGLLLSGVAVSTLLGAITTFLISMNLANQQMTQQILFWTMGGLDNRQWLHVQLALPFLAAGIALALVWSRELDLLAQGDETALTLGVAVERARFIVMLGAALLCGASVAVAGLVGFVGLVVPHVVRLLLGPVHARLLPASALVGALFVVLCDLVCRTVRAPMEVQLGIVTALCGGPYFLWLLQRRLREGSLA
jgi:iron complex transport system permease protein